MIKLEHDDDDDDDDDNNNNNNKIIINEKYSGIIGSKLSGPPAVPGCRRITVSPPRARVRVCVCACVRACVCVVGKGSKRAATEYIYSTQIKYYMSVINITFILYTMVYMSGPDIYTSVYKINYVLLTDVYYLICML